MQRRTGIALVGVTALAVGLYAAVGFLWLPRYLRATVLETFERDVGRKVTLEQVAFNPFTFALDARGFALPDTDGSRLAGFARLHVDFEVASLWKRAWTFGEIALEDPTLHLVQRADGTLNVSELRRAPDAERPAGEPAVPALAIGELRVSGGQVEIEDRQRAEPFTTTLRPVTFALTGFETRGDGNTFSFSAGSDRAGRMQVDGTMGVNPLESRGRLALTGLPAVTVTEYLGEALPVALTAGTIALQLDYDFSLAGEPYRLALSLPGATARGLETIARGHDVAWQWPAIDLKDARIDVPARRVDIGAIAASAPVTPVWLDAAGLQMPGVLAREPPAVAGTAGPGAVAPPEGAEAPAAPAAPGWRIRIPDIRVTDAVVNLEDRTLARPAPLALTLRELKLTAFSWPQDAPIGISARVASAAGGGAGLDGTLKLSPATLSAEVTTEALDLTPLQAWLDEGTDLKLRSGTVTSRGQFEFGSESRPRLRYAGDVTVERLHTQDGTMERDFINWSSLELRRFELAREPARLAIREVVARDPYLRLILAESGVTNVLSVLDPEAAARRAAEIAAERAAIAAGRKPAGDDDEEDAAPAAAEQSPPARRMPMRIGAMRIVNGSVNFSDFTLQPNFQIAVERLAGRISGMTSEPGQRAQVALAGEVDRYAPAKIDGELNLLAAQSYLDIAASFRNIELTSFNPYSGKFAGYRIDKGKLSIETRYRVENRRLAAEQHFTLDQLQLGERVESPDAVSLPLRLAVALLKDRNGVIDIDLPVTGSLDDPKFRLGPIVWKAVLRLLAKIVTSPFALLGSLFGGGADLSDVAFAPGSAALDATASGRLAGLKKALIERPGLNLDVPATVAPSADHAALVEARWGELVAGLDPVDRKARLAGLARLYRARLGRAPEIPKPPKPAPGEPAGDATEQAIAFLEPALRATLVVDEAALAALGQARAEAVRDALLGDGAVDPARVFIIRGEPAAGTDGAVKLPLTLK